MKARILQLAAFAIGVGIVVMAIWFLTNRKKTGTETAFVKGDSSTGIDKPKPGVMEGPYRPDPKVAVPASPQTAKN